MPHAQSILDLLVILQQSWEPVSQQMSLNALKKTDPCAQGMPSSACVLDYAHWMVHLLSYERIQPQDLQHSAMIPTSASFGLP